MFSLQCIAQALGNTDGETRDVEARTSQLKQRNEARNFDQLLADLQSVQAENEGILQEIEAASAE